MDTDKNPASDIANSSTHWLDYANVVSRAQGYQLDESQLARVAAQLELINAVAAPLLALQLAAELEPAPVFRP
jgi:hypothetical protein